MPFIPRVISEDFDRHPFSEDEKSLLRGCLEYPWDDARFLIYSDWVEENGEQDRAEFIREQIRTKSWIVPEHIPEFVREWAKKIHFGEAALYQFHKGLPIDFNLNNPTPDTPTEQTESWDRAFWDWCCSCSVSIISPLVLSHILKSPYLQNVMELSLWGEDDYHAFTKPSEAKKFASAQTLCNTRYLNLTSQKIPDESMQYLVESPHLENLDKFHFAYCIMTTKGFQILMRSMIIPRLTRLYFAGCSFRKDWLKTISKLEAMPKLNDILFDQCEITDEIGCELFKAPLFHSATELSFEDNELGDKTADVIAQTPAFIKLLKLNLNYNALSEKGVHALKQSPYLQNCELVGLDFQK